MGSSIAFAAVAALAAQSAASAPQPLQPSGPWNVEFAESMCILAREFGQGANKVTLGFKPGLFSEHVRVILVQQSPAGRLKFGEAQLGFDGAAPLNVPYTEQYAGGQRVMMLDLKQSDLAPLPTARQLWLRAGKHEFRLAPTAVAAAMRVVDSCQKDLLIGWGMDPKLLGSIAAFPNILGELRALFSPTDYPLPAIRANHQGTAGVRFWVGKDGMARDCKVVESSGSSWLDAKTCTVIVRRARFQPARTAAGEAVESIGFQRVRWVLP